MAGLRETKVMEVWENSEQGGGWNSNFGRLFNDWEMDNVESLIGRVRGRKINPVVEDKMVWKATKDGSYIVRSNLDVLEGGRGAEPFPKRMVGNQLVPTKVGFFAWEAWWGKVLTLSQLKRRGFSLANRCYLCGEEEDNIDHLLTHCLKIRILWSSLLTALDIAWVPPLMTKDVIISWNKIPLRTIARF